jgi:hypothetical protein
VYVLDKALNDPPVSLTEAIKATTLPGAASISKTNALTASTTEVPASNRNYLLAQQVFGIEHPQLYQTFHLIAEAHTIRDLWKQAAAAAQQGNTAEAERLSQLAADRVERAWHNHADLVERRNAARASTNQRKAAARQAQQPDALDGTQSTIRDTSLMLLARLPLHRLEQGPEKLKERPAAEYSTAGTLYHLGVDGKEAAERVREFVVPKLHTLTDILLGRTVDFLAGANSSTIHVRAARQKANALAKELADDSWRNVVAIGMLTKTITGVLPVLLLGLTVTVCALSTNPMECKQ